MRLVLVFDHDGFTPSEPAKPSRDLRDLCDAEKVHHHPLERRSIENYIPVKALRRRVDRLPQERREAFEQRVEALGALAKIRPDIRNHYNMKDGLCGDMRETLPAPFNAIPDELLAPLASGFGDKIAPLVYNDAQIPIRESWIRDDGSAGEIPLLHPELRDAIESFRRLNTRGTRMQEADLLRALSWSDDFDLSLRLAPVRQKLAEIGWEEVEEDSLVDLCKLEVGLAPYSYAPERFGELVRKDATVFRRVEEKMLRAVVFLRDRCGVDGLPALPYAFQLVLLAHTLPADVMDDRTVSSRATEWFWKTTWTHYFASQRRISQAVKNLQAWLRGSNVPRLLDDDAVEAAGRFDFRRARDKALALLLLRRGGDTRERATKLGREGKRFVHPLVPDHRSRRTAAGNVVIASEDEIASLRARLLGATGPRDPALLDQHAIDEAAHERLIAGDGEGFVRARLEHLRRLERAAVESLGLRYVVVDLPEQPGNDGPLFDRGDEDDRD